MPGSPYCRRFASSNISFVGPPPPSPNPKSINVSSVRSLFWNRLKVPSVILGLTMPVYVVVFLVSVNDTFNPWVLSKSQAVGMNTNTLLPSIPFHMKVSLGSWLNWFQAILVVRK